MEEIIVVSDLHLGRGKNPRSGRFHRLEAFFYDDDFLRFCEYLCDETAGRGARFTMVIAGDGFDLLRIEADPEQDSGWTDRRYGPAMTPQLAARTVGHILEGHPAFTEALAKVLLGGNRLVFLPGNHDIELQWHQVQQTIRDAVLARIRDRATDDAVKDASDRLEFRPWFYYEPDRIWIEHGCQYDADNAFDNYLRGGLADLPEDVVQSEQDFPLGSFFQRYLYNFFGGLTFIVPTSRANGRYFKWLLMHRPRILTRVAVSHLPFFLQLIRRLARSDRSARRELRRVHDEELTRLATSSGLGDKLAKVEQLKQVQPDVARAMWDVTWQFFRFGLLALVIALFGAGLWFAGFHAISQVRIGFGLKAVLFLGLNFLLLTSATVGIAYLLLRSSPELSPRPLRQAAKQIARALGVPMVVFGHSHEENIAPVGTAPTDPAWYYNTGTWIAVFTHDQLLPRERVQFTYLRVRERDAELLYWSPGRGGPAPVVLLEEDEADGRPSRPAEAQPK